MQMRKALGRGLDSLIPVSEESIPREILGPKIVTQPVTGDRIKTVPINSIIPNRLQPRKVFDEEKIKDLAASIKKQGIIQPLIVNQAMAGNYELIAGERRLRASKLAGLTELPVVIKNVDSEKMLKLSIIENIQREDLNPIEEASAIHELIDQFGYTQDEAATSLGKSRVAVTNSLRLLNLPKVVQEDVISEKMTAGHARALLSLTSLQEQLKMREKILQANLTVRDVEKMIQDLRPATTRTIKKSSVQLTPQMKYISDEITKQLATKIRLEPDREKKGGRIVIEYYTPQDLDRIYNLIVK